MLFERARTSEPRRRALLLGLAGGVFGHGSRMQINLLSVLQCSWASAWRASQCRRSCCDCGAV